MVCFSQSLNSEFLCKEIYSKALRHSTRALFSRDPIFKLLEDNDPKQWKHEYGIKCSPWPPCSPDINLTENLWNILKIRVAAKKSNNVPALIRLIERERKKLPVELCENLVDRMQRRIDAVISADGDYTMC